MKLALNQATVKRLTLAEAVAGCARDTAHLTELYRLAQLAGVIDDPDLAESRFKAVVA